MLFLKKLVRWLIPLVFAATMCMGHVAHATVTQLAPGKIYISGTFETPDDVTFLQATVVDRDYHIQINSTGGFVSMYFPMRERVRELQKRGFTITTEVMGEAYSCGAFLWMLGDIRIFHEASVMMFHKSFLSTSWGKIEEENMTEWQKNDVAFANQIYRQDLLNLLRDTNLVNALLGDEDYWIYGKDMINLDLCTHYIQ